MTVQELRDLLDAFYAEQAAVKEGEEVEMRKVTLGAAQATLSGAAVDALPTLLDVAEAARLHDCCTTAGYTANVRAHTEQPCPICDALDRLGETP